MAHTTIKQGGGQSKYLVAAEFFAGILSTPWGFAAAGPVFSLRSAGGRNGSVVLVSPQG